MVVTMVAVGATRRRLTRDRFRWLALRSTHVTVTRDRFRWLALFSTILAISRSFSVERAYPTVALNPNAILDALATNTHYMPSHWRGQAHTRRVYMEFRRLYQYRAALLLQEILGCITAPLLLIFVMPAKAQETLDFIRDFTAYAEGVGHVCSFALFDFERHGASRRVTTAWNGVL